MLLAASDQAGAGGATEVRQVELQSRGKGGGEREKEEGGKGERRIRT